MRSITRIATCSAAAAAITLLGAGAANAAPFEIAGALPGENIMKDKVHAKAADGLGLAVSIADGEAMAVADGYSGPAAIAVGENAKVHAHGVAPGLAMGIAGPNSTVVITGDTPVTCDGEFGFAGDFQTLTGCVAYVDMNGEQNMLPIDINPEVQR